ncbi:dihydrofolate reductase [Geoanaerobacter pelophilus]|uniref:dihydrofolate reductase n=1 Tax=Geoanaerobacter pelophilus TaxID=60036 RepID=A0ABQ0MII5_9BACT|nr:dihydrofolate reductase [Geoanaerobacter pelophilus]GAW66889.1 dihydrofolate reductase [Geoanaerobacter pelophilus]
MMIISTIAAMSDNRVIGAGGRLPWDIPSDLTRFRSITMGHAVIMGRKTYESIGQPLIGRRNIVLTRRGSQIEGCEIARNLHAAIAAAEGEEEVFICGGGEVFEEALPLCQRVYLTIVHGNYQGDVLFPELPAGFVELHREEFPDTTPPSSFVVMEKVERVEAGVDAQQLRRKGLEALNRQLFFLARRCFEQAQALEENPETASDLAFSLIKSGGEARQAREMAEKALWQEPKNIRIILNTGRVLILSGDKSKGLDTLRKGVKAGGGPEFLAELARCGTRKLQPIKSLPRSHPLNRYLGLMLHRMNLK